MTLRTSYRLLIESEQDSEHPRSIGIDSRHDHPDGPTLIVEWNDSSNAYDDRYGSEVELTRDEALELIGAIKSALGIEPVEIEGVFSDADAAELRRAGLEATD